MTTNTQKSKISPKPSPRSFVEEQFIHVVDTMKKENKKSKKIPHTYEHFCQALNVRLSFINDLKRGVSITATQLINFCAIYDVDANLFCNRSVPIHYESESEKEPDQGNVATDNSVIAKDKSTVNVNSGTIHGKVHIGDKNIKTYAENLINKIPPELRDDMRALVLETRGIKKIDDITDPEKTNLVNKVAELEQELRIVKDELLNCYRSKNSNK